MTKREKQQLKQLIALLKRAANIADILEINLLNGAEVGSLIGSTADELELRAEAPGASLST